MGRGDQKLPQIYGQTVHRIRNSEFERIVDNGSSLIQTVKGGCRGLYSTAEKRLTASDLLLLPPPPPPPPPVPPPLLPLRRHRRDPGDAAVLHPRPPLPVLQQVEVAERRVDRRVGKVEPKELAHVRYQPQALRRRERRRLRNGVPGMRERRPTVSQSVSQSVTQPPQQGRGLDNFNKLLKAYDVSGSILHGRPIRHLFASHGWVGLCGPQGEREREEGRNWQ